MKKRNFKTVLLVLTMGILFSSGCGVNTVKNVERKEGVTPEKDTQEETENRVSEAVEGKSTEGENSEISGDAGQKTEVGTDSIFENASNYEFWFSSGAGGWSTTLTLQPDGTFWGEYHDSDMGDTGENYPNGVQYRCDFYGKFTEPVQVNAYTYEFQIENIRYNRNPGEEEIIGGRKYIYSEPYGLDKAKKMNLYVPEAPTKELPKEYLDWVNLGSDDTQRNTLGYYGLYNVAMKEGFSSMQISQEAVALNRELAELEANE